MALDDASSKYLFVTPQKEVVILFSDKTGLQNECFPFPRCFKVKSDKEGAVIFFLGKKLRLIIL